ncbi:MAG: argininosuccinate lyase [Bacteroidetes bacterium]|nr:argininosuccinate lyase [Bacteroidota bacterium]MDA1268095.1 argininosuccinate lyase [Bacteroidota bacterium]
MKLWQKNTTSKKEVEHFTVGRDPEFDILLAPYDVLGSMAHAAMLNSIGLLTGEENEILQKGLKEIYEEIKQGKFVIEAGVEDVHSQVELVLTRRFGAVGKKLHSGRSRNDQVLVDLKLFYRDAIRELFDEASSLAEQLIQLAETYKEDLMPGYTHTQLAMPSSFGLWFASFAEGLSEDLSLLQVAFELSNKNPLGSAAGYGSSFPLDRTITTRLLGFPDMHHNVLNAQNSRGKTERTIAFALAGMAGTLNKLSSDVVLFCNQHFGFISFPDELTTGSSIMPHKKNPDVFELIRAKTNQIQSLPGTIGQLLGNLTSGYHRDMQLLKEEIFPGLESLRSCLQMSNFMLKSIQIRKNILEDPFYIHLFSVEAVNELVLKGVPFRDAYKQIGEDIEANRFVPNQKIVVHSHEGSIGNLSLNEIRAKLKLACSKFDFEGIDRAVKILIDLK